MTYISLRSLERREKRDRLLALMDRQQLDAILLARQSNFAWYSGGGASYVALPGDVGAGYLLISSDTTTLIADRIEMPRLMQEEVPDAGYKLAMCEWYDDKLAFALKQASGLRVGTDIAVNDSGAAKSVINIATQIAAERYSLTTAEVQRYEWVGEQCGDAIGKVCKSIEPGMTEYAIAGALSQQVYARGITPILALVASDERIYKYRHPLPTDRKLEKYAMVVLCGRKWGLVASVSRLVHFGPVDTDLQKRIDACARVDATFILNTRPGMPVVDIFNKAVAAYAATGYPDEWKLHHQGGGTGYESRDFRAGPNSSEVVQDWQAFAWNPSIAGCKSEDTMIATGSDRSEDTPAYKILTATPDWPMTDVTTDQGTIQRPAVLIR